MIPVLGVPALNRPDLLDRMLRSIDIDVDRYVIIDNSAERIVNSVPVPDNATVIAPRHNLGVSASWNLITQATPFAPWWCIVNNDIEFAPGDLASLVAQVESDREAFTFLATPSAFALTSQVLDRVGWFDENFVPGYGEDNDYVRRVMLAGMRSVALPAHYSHVVSATIGSDPLLADENHRTFPLNMAYYIEKWGGPPGGERFVTPFDKGGDIRDWPLRPERLRSLTWRL